FLFFSSRRRHTRFSRDWSSDVCSSDLTLQVVEDDDVPIVRLSPHELEHRDHAGALHEVAAARHVVVKDRFDVVASSGRVVAATMLLALQPVAVVSLLLVGNPAVDDGLLVSRMRHGGPSSEVNAGLPGYWADGILCAAAS